MADTGRIQKTYDFYVDKETAAENLTKGDLVHADVTTAKVRLCDGDGTDTPPYGVVLETTSADATGLVCWRGVVEVTATPGAAIKKITPLAAGAGKITAAWTTATAEHQIVGHALEDVTTASTEIKIMLAGW